LTHRVVVDPPRLDDHPVELPRHASAAPRELRDDAHSAPVVVVDHSRPPQPPAIVELVREACRSVARRAHRHDPDELLFRERLAFRHKSLRRRRDRERAACRAAPPRDPSERIATLDEAAVLLRHEGRAALAELRALTSAQTAEKPLRAISGQIAGRNETELAPNSLGGLVELSGIEPLTSSLRTRRSPS
jgi:hypothetical protein